MDELYTIVEKPADPMGSKGWTTVLMDRASRFIVDQRCGKKMLRSEEKNLHFRIKTTNSKTKKELQQTLEVQELMHNFVRPIG